MQDIKAEELIAMLDKAVHAGELSRNQGWSIFYIFSTTKKQSKEIMQVNCAQLAKELHTEITTIKIALLFLVNKGYAAINSVILEEFFYEPIVELRLTNNTKKKTVH